MTGFEASEIRVPPVKRRWTAILKVAARLVSRRRKREVGLIPEREPDPRHFQGPTQVVGPNSVTWIYLRNHL
ncbi:hypothetical protein [Glycomyces salinus]|uniref:hypothetical protein n=1 Tax=Glycomyces salinus TaxID=980294 RepID=UPI0018ED26EF|nr:hypothetical protein [Glycomyces salinus]